MDFWCDRCGLSDEDLMDDLEPEEMEFVFSDDSGLSLCAGCEDE